MPQTDTTRTLKWIARIYSHNYINTLTTTLCEAPSQLYYRSWNHISILKVPEGGGANRNTRRKPLLGVQGKVFICLECLTWLCCTVVLWTHSSWLHTKWTSEHRQNHSHMHKHILKHRTVSGRRYHPHHHQTSLPEEGTVYFQDWQTKHKLFTSKTWRLKKYFVLFHFDSYFCRQLSKPYQQQKMLWTWRAGEGFLLFMLLLRQLKLIFIVTLSNLAELWWGIV